MKRLRDVLRDSADQPRYIETMARQGYRFIGQVNVSNQPASAAPVAVIPVEDLPSPPNPSRLSAGCSLSRDLGFYRCSAGR